MSKQTHLEVFKSEYHMLKFFGEYLEKLDVNTSARLGAFLYSYDGKLVLARGLYDFLTQMEKMTALGIDTMASAQKGTSFLVFFKEKPKDPLKFRLDVKKIEAVKEAIVADTPSKVMEESVLVNTKVEEVEVKAESSDRTEEEKAQILTKAEELRDDSKKAASKAALEAFAVEYGISLSKGKTFDGMLEDLAAAL
ncbi:hypothetical protein A71_109 [Escherichia phage A7_1]|uniref:Inh N-terminal domain-containing protein n=1 Tax=Escherichia phage A5-4 TaxID=2996162 RepID=A0AAE9PXP9_9CAUD|nr:hypothetical protein A71_109 [Escherichia phage A7_1]UZZ64187.1 hypothetical protein A54_223 [Escherichia phage A5-4]